ncbi:HAD hydrolase-like protein [Nocardioides soli]|uniref:HAD superfamily hydrolase (TIGR01450 family) n=1 Tax=Nocardioides soli TaxID=1036020 RepID=A0A7W4W2F1_9ACTN|nr:HAD superfamily hydrolase (TIGR01450 family) [Nocardioides soli]
MTGLSRLTGVEGWILDVDGCLVRTSRAGGTGGTPIPGAAELLTGLAERGHRVVVCTNASELPPAAYAEHLREIGLPVADEDFVTAGSAGADHIAAAHPGGRVVAVGGPGITVPLRERGLEVVEADGLRDPGECAAVLVGAAPSYTHAALNAACLAIEAGAPLYVSQNQPWFHGGAGRSIAISAVMAAAIAWATGAGAEVTGKPSPVLAEALRHRLGVPAERIAVVGDATAEIELARAIGAQAVTVLSGALTADAVAALPDVRRPDHVLPDVAALHHLLSRTPDSAPVSDRTPGVLS